MILRYKIHVVNHVIRLKVRLFFCCSKRFNLALERTLFLILFKNACILLCYLFHKATIHARIWNNVRDLCFNIWNQLIWSWVRWRYCWNMTLFAWKMRIIVRNLLTLINVLIKIKLNWHDRLIYFFLLERTN